MNKNLKIILIIFTTFIITFVTSLLLEIEIFKNIVRYVLVILLIIFELYVGFILYKSSLK
jgi:VIT1/CCC1 family predicted Fe2+/Mn2+ transporter